MRSKGKLPTEMALLARKNVFTLVSQAELGFSLMQQKYGFVWTECTPTSSALSLWIYPTDWAIEGVSWKKWRVFLQGFNKQTLSVRLSAKNEWDVPDWFVPIDVCWVNQTYTVYIYIPLIHWYSTKVILFDSMETLASSWALRWPQKRSAFRCFTMASRPCAKTNHGVGGCLKMLTIMYTLW